MPSWQGIRIVVIYIYIKPNADRDSDAVREKRGARILFGINSISADVICLSPGDCASNPNPRCDFTLSQAHSLSRYSSFHSWFYITREIYLLELPSIRFVGRERDAYEKSFLGGLSAFVFYLFILEKTRFESCFWNLMVDMKRFYFVMKTHHEKIHSQN